jgi:hypothetical protein
MPDVASLLGGGAAPDTEGKANPQREVQARCPRRTGLADLLSLLGLMFRGAGGTFGEEQFGIVVTAGRAVTPVGGVANSPRGVPHHRPFLLITAQSPGSQYSR